MSREHPKGTLSLRSGAQGRVERLAESSAAGVTMCFHTASKAGMAEYHQGFLNPVDNHHRPLPVWPCRYPVDLPSETGSTAGCVFHRPV